MKRLSIYPLEQMENAFIGSLIYEPAVRSEDTTVKVFLTISFHFYFFKLM